MRVSKILEYLEVAEAERSKLHEFWVTKCVEQIPIGQLRKAKTFGNMRSKGGRPPNKQTFDSETAEKIYETYNKGNIRELI